MIDFYAVLSTVTRWVSASTGLMAFVLFLPGIFVEHSCSNLLDPATTTKNIPEGISNTGAQNKINTLLNCNHNKDDRI